MQKTVKMIAMDLDGTLLNSKKQISDGNFDAITQARKQGIYTTICSGRGAEDVSMLLEERGLDCPIICINGGMSIDMPFGEIVFSHFMPLPYAEEAIRIIEAHHQFFFLFASSAIIARDPSRQHPAQVRWGEKVVEKTGLSFSIGLDEMMQAIHERGTLKMIVVNHEHPEELIPLREALRASGRFEISKSADTNIEVMPKGVSKGNAVLEIAKKIDVKAEEILCLGDDENDLSMLTRVGFGVAMGNAPQVIKEQVRYITRSNDEDGVAAAIREYALC